ncbi:SRPBCC family protein [Streptomyces sp. STR69]|uniref:SRPBCC family protein n=1 Tax=Streptomyces sp. STR69 TaxID=1796942 RepID=UPI0021CA7221|nr:SRPBCC family protein [Streptomyces sp. STR69]
MPSQRMHSARHTALVAAPPGVVYGLLADAPRWPVLLPSYVHVERVDLDAGGDSLRVWQLHRGQVRSVLARRVLRPRERRIEFGLRDSLLPDAPTSGGWNVSPDGTDRCRVTLRQERPAGPGGTPGALEAQVRAELAAVREAAERWDRLDELLLSFEDSVYVCGSPEIVYDFLYRVGDWADLVPHVERAEVTEDRPGVQRTVLHTSDPSTGDTSVSEAVRLCFPAAGRIVHQATVTPAPLAAHYGEWYLEPDARGVRVVCAHQVMLREGAATPALGAGALPADVRRHVREQLGRTSTEALALARWHAESALRRLR